VSTDRDVDRIVRSWMDEGVTQLPDRVLDLVLDQLPATPQRRPSWLARRFPFMNRPMLTAAAGVAVVVLALVGYRLLRGNVGVQPSPSPSPTPVPTPSPSPAPLRAGQVLEAGTYRVTVLGTVEATIIVPAGWLAGADDGSPTTGRITTSLR
jgi:hypothetical protein